MFLSTVQTAISGAKEAPLEFYPLLGGVVGLVAMAIRWVLDFVDGHDTGGYGPAQTFSPLPECRRERRRKLLLRYYLPFQLIGLVPLAVGIFT